jgi:hypothetical protein
MNASTADLIEGYSAYATADELGQMMDAPGIITTITTITPSSEPCLISAAASIAKTIEAGC